MQIALDTNNIILLEDPGHGLDTCDANLQYDRANDTYRAYNGFVKFDGEGMYYEIDLTNNAYVDDIQVGHMDDNCVSVLRAQANGYGYVFNKTADGAYIMRDELIAKLIDNTGILLRNDIQLMRNIYGEGVQVGYNSMYWNSADGAFSKSVTEFDNSYKVTAWGVFMLFGLPFGEPIQLSDVRNVTYYYTENEGQIKFRYDGLDIVASCQKWDNDIVTLMGVSFTINH